MNFFSGALLLIALAAALPGAAAASGERVEGLGLTGYVRDEEADLDLNPAFAAGVEGNRLFFGVEGDWARTKIIFTDTESRSRSRSFSPSAEFLWKAAGWTWAAKWEPSFSRDRDATVRFGAAPARGPGK